jgi:small subunit ribosomal protein S21
MFAAPEFPVASGVMIEVKVTNEQVDRAMRELKRKLIKEGLFKELSRRKFYIKPSVARRIKRSQAEKIRKKEAARERERMLR